MLVHSLIMAEATMRRYDGTQQNWCWTGVGLHVSSTKRLNEFGSWSPFKLLVRLSRHILRCDAIAVNIK